jgi:alkylated DNA repair dioxygenase AlkB
LFPPSNSPSDALIPGLRYHPALISEVEEHALVTALSNLPLKPFEFHGHLGNRRTASFGLRYDYARGGLQLADSPPRFLDALLLKVAEFAGRALDDFRQVGINEYRPGAGIGWHRDKPEFGDVVGVSLVSTVKMRFRRRSGKGWTRASQILEPRSVYLLTGESRKLWEHSIAPVPSLRYSLTFRTLVAGEVTLLNTA